MKTQYEAPTTEVSERMRRVKSTGTSIENEMKNMLDELQIEYEEQPKLPGRPDFRIAGTNILIFCDSSFWHGRRKKEIDGSAFDRNKEFWMKKLMENKKRDQRNNRITTTTKGSLTTDLFIFHYTSNEWI